MEEPAEYVTNKMEQQDAELQEKVKELNDLVNHQTRIIKHLEESAAHEQKKMSLIVSNSDRILKERDHAVEAFTDLRARVVRLQEEKRILEETIERSKAKCEALQSENNSERPNTIPFPVPFPVPFPTNPAEEFVLWRLRKISHAELRELETPTSDALYQIEVRPESAYVKEYRKVPATVNVDIKAFAEHVLYATYRDCIKDNCSPTQTYVEQFQILCKAAQRALDKLKLLPGPDIVQNAAIRELVNLIGLEQLQEQLSGPVVPPVGNPLSYIHHVATCAKIQPIAVSAGFCPPDLVPQAPKDEPDHPVLPGN